MYDLNEFKANFPAENRNLPAVVAREFGDAISASQSIKAVEPGPIHLYCQTALRVFTSIVRPASWSNFGKTTIYR
jgi:hypothetical protein|tara:strand:- start:423 stop:647 length:225 start_codon:yes stop_codon:yes gene_type:complete